MRLFIRIFLLASLLIAAAALWVWYDMEQTMTQPMPLQATERLVVEPGSNLRSLANELVQRGWLEHPYYLRLHARQTDMGRRIKAGEYDILPGTTPQGLLDQLVRGQVVQYALTIVEGWNFRDLLKALQQHERIRKTLSPALAGDPAGLMAALDLPSEHPEGQFYPDTYHFPKGTTDVGFLKRAYRRMQAVLGEEWRQRADDLPYDNAYEALIMASIIEKETGVPHERDRIAGVFVRRMEKGMRLQTDPTVIYALGENYDGRITRSDLRFDSPYNTYVTDGLPPTPIALPGRAAIHAALNPADGKALYFVSRGDGSHYFSETLNEHNRAVAKYQLGRDDIELENE